MCTARELDNDIICLGTKAASSNNWLLINFEEELAILHPQVFKWLQKSINIKAYMPYKEIQDKSDFYNKAMLRQN